MILSGRGADETAVVWGSTVGLWSAVWDVLCTTTCL